MSIAHWYNTQYSIWNRTRRLQTTPYLARTGTNTSQAATVMAQQGGQIQAVDATAQGKDKKASEPLFGPNIGSVMNGPAWTVSNEKKVVRDELTPDVVSGWIEKSKESSQPTTTLQALVNLKRPTLRLSPLTSANDDGTPHPADQHHHGLEFEYDCDAPKCGIYVHVYLPKSHPDAPVTATQNLLSKLLVFETVVDGGFGRHLTLEEGALLELGRFEYPHAQDSGDSAHELAPVGEASSSGDLVGSPSTETGQHGRNNQRRRFTHFHFRKRTHNHSISGPALAVVDADPTVPQEGGKAKDAKQDSDEGVKVTIRLAALDEQGTELASPNEQITYLHIVRFGQKGVDDANPAEPADDNRPWVVKVVKREATIGAHTFHLHEIYGLTSASSKTPAPTAPPPMVSHTYPPEEGQAQHVIQADEEDPQSECLLCLSSPREVVLLPCRHLVACKDCALNMVEFGAGGNITQASEPVGTAAGEEATPGVPGTPGAAAVTPAAPGTTTTGQRRKRKAKGWFCPVCRQPYTSMLRLTTAPPPMPESKEGEGSGTEDEGLPVAPDTIHGASAQTAPPTEMRSTGLLGARPAFLRGLSLGRAPPVDVENQNAAVRA